MSSLSVNMNPFRALDAQLSKLKAMSEQELDQLLEQVDINSEPENNLPPNAFRELMPPSQTFGEGDG